MSKKMLTRVGLTMNSQREIHKKELVKKVVFCKPKFNTSLQVLPRKDSSKCT